MQTSKKLLVPAGWSLLVVGFALIASGKGADQNDIDRTGETTGRASHARSGGRHRRHQFGEPANHGSTTCACWPQRRSCKSLSFGERESRMRESMLC